MQLKTCKCKHASANICKGDIETRRRRSGIIITKLLDSCGMHFCVLSFLGLARTVYIQTVYGRIIDQIPATDYRVYIVYTYIASGQP